MNERYNKIAGCDHNAVATKIQMEFAAKRLAEAFIQWQDNGAESITDVERLAKDYRAAQEAYADALDQLADALRR
jgi:hypothetical protein